MKPQLLIAGYLRDFAQRIDRSCRGGARGSDDDERRKAGSTVARYRLSKVVQVHHLAVVDLHEMNPFTSEADHVCRLLHPRVRLG